MARHARYEIFGKNYAYYFRNYQFDDNANFNKSQRAKIDKIFKDECELYGVELFLLIVTTRGYHAIVEMPEKAPMSNELTEKKIRKFVGDKEADFFKTAVNTPKRKRFRMQELICDKYLSDRTISRFSSKLNQKIARYLNKTKGENGSLWRDRMYSTPLSFLTDPRKEAIAFLATRPVADGMVKNFCKCKEGDYFAAVSGKKEIRAKVKVFTGETWSQVNKFVIENAPKYINCKRTPFLVLGADVDETELKGSIRRTRKSKSKIDKKKLRDIEMLKQLKAFKNKFGHSCVRLRDEGYRDLAQWCNLQRNAFRKKFISPERVEQLEAMSFSWKLLDNSASIAFAPSVAWYNSLNKYKKEFNNIYLSKSSKAWERRQIAEIEKGKLSKVAIKELYKIGNMKLTKEIKQIIKNNK